MTRIAQAASAALALLSLAGTPAHADDRADDIATCLEPFRGQPGIDACTRLIESGSLGADDLHDAYHMRGLDYSGDPVNYARAIQDFDEAIRLKPDDADSLYNRGMIEGEKGNKAAQDADLAKARAIDPNVGQ